MKISNSAIICLECEVKQKLELLLESNKSIFRLLLMRLIIRAKNVRITFSKCAQERFGSFSDVYLASIPVKIVLIDIAYNQHYLQK